MNQKKLKKLKKRAEKVKTLDEVIEEIKEHMAKISQLFKPGCKFTFIMRIPGVKNGDVIISSEQNLKFPIKTLKEYKKNFKPGNEQ